MISPHPHAALAQARADDFSRTASNRRLARLAAQPALASAAGRSVILRFGSPADEKALAWLAALDSAPTPAQPVLLAEVDGQLLAALVLSDGSVVADPFHRTADLIDLLHQRAHQLDANRRPERFRLRRWLRVRVPAWR